MSMQDPIADMLARIKNGQMAKKETITLGSSKVKVAILKVLRDEGYIKDFQVSDEKLPQVTVTLKYFEGEPVISTLDRVSKPSLRVYKGKSDLPKILDGLGVAIISTNRGMMTDREARKQNCGGEVVCSVS